VLFKRVMETIMISNLSGEDKDFLFPRESTLDFAKYYICEAFDKPFFEVALVDIRTLQLYSAPHSTPFMSGSSMYNAKFSWRSRWAAGLQGLLLALKNSAEFEEDQCNPPESALAGGAYNCSCPQTRSKWHDQGCLSLQETLAHIGKQAFPRLYAESKWPAALRKAMCIHSKRLSLSNVRMVNVVAQEYPTDVGPCVELAIMGLRHYLREHDIRLNPVIKRRLRKKTQMKTLWLRVGAHNSRVASLMTSAS